MESSYLKNTFAFPFRFIQVIPAKAGIQNMRTSILSLRGSRTMKSIGRRSNLSDPTEWDRDLVRHRSAMTRRTKIGLPQISLSVQIASFVEFIPLTAGFIRNDSFITFWIGLYSALQSYRR
jgi:hypothetical protein